MYANFSGINDVSIGAAGLMGIAVKENFNRPYLSQSVTEMYTRWHMTLSEWMRDIVFFPLAAFLMRRATWLSRYQSSAVATMTVFILFGVWQAAQASAGNTGSWGSSWARPSSSNFISGNGLGSGPKPGVSLSRRGCQGGPHALRKPLFRDGCVADVDQLATTRCDSRRLDKRDSSIFMSE